MSILSNGEEKPANDPDKTVETKWLKPTDCVARTYLPDGSHLTYGLAAYKITHGIVEYIPRDGRDGSIISKINILCAAAIDIQNGDGLSFNEELFDKVREEVRAKIEYDKKWSEVIP